MDKELAIMYINHFIQEMTLTLKNKKNRSYAPQVFWKYKYTLEQIKSWLEENK
jgi:hypothetical protein